MKCNFNYKGSTYTEEEVKPIVSYHYMVEDALLKNNNFEKIGNVVQVVEKEDFGDLPVTSKPDVSEFIESMNTSYGAGNPIVTLEGSGIVDIDVNPIADKILNKSISNNPDTDISDGGYNRKAYNLEGVDEETLADMEAKVSLMEQRFNALGITTHFIMDGDLDSSGALLGTGSTRYKELVASGEISNGDAVIVVNPNQLYADTVFHEYGHLFIDLAGGMNNPRIKYAYSKIQNSPLAQQVKENYPELTGDMLAKEILATALGKEATEIFNGNNPDVGFIQKFLNWIRDSISKMFGIQVSSIKDLANELLGNTQDFALNSQMESASQLYKPYTQDIPKMDRMIKGAENTVKEIASKINITLNTFGKTSDPDKVEFKSTVKAMEENIATLSKKSNLLAIDSYLNKALELGSTIQSDLEEFLIKANKGERIQVDYKVLNDVETYKGLFDLLEEIQNSAVSGYFVNEFKTEGWDDIANQKFIETIDSAKAQFDKVHDLHIKVGRHHAADKLVKYSNRTIVTRRMQLEQEYKKTNPRMDGEKSNQYNARIREKVDAQIVTEMQSLKEQERELLYNRLSSSPADIGGFARLVSSEKDLNSMIIQLASKLLDEADLRRDLQMQNKKLEAFAIFEAFNKETSGVGAKEKYKGLYQEGSDGNLYYTSEYDVEFGIKLNALNKAVYDAEQKDPKGKEYSDAVNSKKKWLRANATTQNVDGMNIYTPLDKWKSKDYAKIMSNKESGKAKMLKYLLDESSENSKMLHGNRSLVTAPQGTEVNMYRVPSIGRSVFEKATDGDFLNGIKDSFERIYRTKTDDADFVGDTSDLENEKKGLKVIANRKGDIKYGVPIHFRGKMPLSEISYDLMSSHLMDSYMSMNYKYKSALQVELELLKDITAEKKINQTSGLAKTPFLNAFDKLTQSQIVKKASEDSNELTVLKSIVENRLYGIKNADKEYAKFASSVMSWSASTMLMLNLPSAMTNVLQGKVFNFIEGFSGQFFNREDLRAAEGMFFRDMKGIMNDIGRPVSKAKTNQMLEVFNIQGAFSALSSKMVEDTRFKALMKSNSAYALNHMGEQYMHATLMYAVLNNIKIKNTKGEYIDANGKVVSKAKAMSLSEAITVNEQTGKLQLNKHAYKTSFGNSTIGLGGKDLGLVEVKGLINKIAHDMHGNYNEEIQNMAQRYTIGKFLMMLRKWIVPGFNKRWRGAVYANPLSKNFVSSQAELQDQVENFFSEDLQAFQEGYYTTALRFLTNVVKDLKQMQFHAITSNWDKLSDMEIANMRRTIAEVSLILISLAASSILYALAQGIEDDDESRAVLFHATYYTRRMYSEMMFYFNPIEAYRLMRTPAASLSYIEKLGRFATQITNDAYNVTFGEGLEEYQTGKRKGEYKLWKRTGDVLPMVNQWNRDIEESTGWLYGNF